MDLEVITNVDRLNELRAAWTDLCGRCSPITPFQRPEWIIAWWRCYAPAEPSVLALWHDSHLVGVAPFLFYSNSGERTLAFFAGGVSDYLDVIVDAAHEHAAMEKIIDWIEAQQWDACDFEPLPETSPLLHAWPEDACSNVEQRDACPVVELPATVDHLPDVVPVRQLSNLRKYRRKAAYQSTCKDWRAGLDLLNSLYQSRWDLDPSAAFLERACRSFAERDALRVQTLYIDGTAAAAALTLDEGDQTFLYRIAFDPACARWSPGVLAIGDAVEQSVERGKRRFDFLRGSEPYKYWWGARDRPTFRRRVQRV